jgi:arylsulfatase A
MNSSLLIATLLTYILLIHGRPNIIFLLTDDLGFGDIGNSGSIRSDIPNINQLSNEGILFTDYYAPASLCTPTRGSIITGRYFRSIGLYPDVLTPFSIGGLIKAYDSFPRYLIRNGYTTHMIGKWHLGVAYGYHPLDHGFESYFGIPFSHDRCISILNTTGAQQNSSFSGPCPLFWNRSIYQQRYFNMMDIDKIYEKRILELMYNVLLHPYYLQIGTHHVHMPQYPLNSFSSSVEALDSFVGTVITNMDHNTLLIFSSDNGATLFFDTLNGINFPFRCGKGSTWEGGHRVPMIFYSKNDMILPNQSRTSNLFFTGLDLFSTILSISETSNDDYHDGYNLWQNIAHGNDTSPRTEFYFHSTRIDGNITKPGAVMAVRWNNYKYHRYISGGNCVDDYYDSVCRLDDIKHRNGSDLYDLDIDPGERFPMRGIEYDGIRFKLDLMIDDHIKSFNDSESVMDWGTDPIGFPCANFDCKPYPHCCHK